MYRKFGSLLIYKLGSSRAMAWGFRLDWLATPPMQAQTLVGDLPLGTADLLESQVSVSQAGMGLELLELGALWAKCQRCRLTGSYWLKHLRPVSGVFLGVDALGLPSLAWAASKVPLSIPAGVMGATTGETDVQLFRMKQIIQRTEWMLLRASSQHRRLIDIDCNRIRMN